MNTSQEINASTMVIRSERGYWRHALDLFLTWMAWAFFTYLVARGIWSLLSPQREASGLPWLSPLLPGFVDLGVYLLAMLLQGGLLVLWARYNYWRFRGSTRRAAPAPTDDDSLLRHYGIPAESLRRLRELPVCVIHHAPDGSIVQVAASLPGDAAPPWVPAPAPAPVLGRQGGRIAALLARWPAASAAQ